MILLDLRALIQKMAEAVKEIFQEALGYCSALTHYDLEISHLLLKLLENESSDFCKAILALSLDKQRIKNDLLAHIEQYSRGNAEVPAISPRVVELLQAACLIGSVEYCQDQIHDVLFLLALYKEPSLQQLLYSYSAEFRRVQQLDVENITKALLSDKIQNNHVAISSKEGALEKYTTDLVKNALQGKIDSVIGRDQEIQQVIDILGRRRQNNPILTGEPGVGKTAIVEGLALLIAQGKVPSRLQQVSIRALDLGLLQAGAGVKGEFEHRLKQLMLEIETSSTPIILFIDEAHTLIGAGGQAGQADAANLLKPALARGNLRTIAATTWAEYKKYFEKDAALSRRFQTVIVNEPSVESAIEMLRQVAQKLEVHHDVLILDEAITKTTILSHRYITSRLLPDKSISVLDTACSRVALMQKSEPAQLIALKNTGENIALEISRLESEQSQGLDHQKRLQQLKLKQNDCSTSMIQLQKQWQCEHEQVQKIKQLQQTGTQKSLQIAIKELKQMQGEKGLVHPFVDEQSVAEVIASWTGIPVGKVLSDEVNNALSLEETLNQRVRGQDHAMHLIAQRVIAAKAKLEDPNKPIAVFLLLGPSGIGKTETALALADTLYGGEKNITVINMSEYKESHKVSLLMGSPPGYVGYGEGGILTEAIRRKPYNLLLLDEMEKAHTGVHDIFYQIFDKGMLRDGEGRDIDFKNTIIIMTSNACSEHILSLHEQSEVVTTPEDMIAKIYPELERHFKPAFLGRTTIIPYYPLNNLILEQIVSLKMNKIAQRLSNNYQAILTVKDDVIKKIVEQCQMTALGARQIDNVINNKILPQIAEQILKFLVTKQRVDKVFIELIEEDKFIVKINAVKEVKKNNKKLVVH